MKTTPESIAAMTAQEFINYQMQEIPCNLIGDDLIRIAAVYTGDVSVMSLYRARLLRDIKGLPFKTICAITRNLGIKTGRKRKDKETAIFNHINEAANVAMGLWLWKIDNDVIQAMDSHPEAFTEMYESDTKDENDPLDFA